jgi:hypothetical protein
LNGFFLYTGIFIIRESNLVLKRNCIDASDHDTICKDAGVRFVIYKLWRTFSTRFVQAGGGNLVTLNDILGHSSLDSATQYVHPTAQHQREAWKRYRSSTPFAASKRITAAQKIQVGRTQNRTRAVNSLLAMQQKVCKT